MTKVEEFKKAFFDLPSRKFGETFVQPILYKILGDARYTDGNDCDALRQGKYKVEYKAVRVVSSVPLSRKSLYEKILRSSVPMSKRIGTLDDIRNNKIVANCQNIKPTDFHYLDYVLVDAEGFHIFEISKVDFLKYTSLPKDNPERFPNWSPNHGRKEKGKNGQFPIKGENLEWHKKHTYLKTVTWEKILEIVSNI